MDDHRQEDEATPHLFDESGSWAVANQGGGTTDVARHIRVAKTAGPTPEREAGWFSYLWWGWMSKFMNYGYSHTLQVRGVVSDCGHPTDGIEATSSEKGRMTR